MGMGPTPVVQVRLATEQIEYLDSLPGTRSEAIRHCVDFTRDNDEDDGSHSGTQADLIEALRQDTQKRVSGYRFSVDECAHPFRDQTNKCRSCGHQR